MVQISECLSYREFELSSDFYEKVLMKVQWEFKNKSSYWKFQLSGDRAICLGTWRIYHEKSENQSDSILESWEYLGKQKRGETIVNCQLQFVKVDCQFSAAFLLSITYLKRDWHKSLQTLHVYATLNRSGNVRFLVVSTLNTRGVFVGIKFHVWFEAIPELWFCLLESARHMCNATEAVRWRCSIN